MDECQTRSLDAQPSVRTCATGNALDGGDLCCQDFLF